MLIGEKLGFNNSEDNALIINNSELQLLNSVFE